jgi:hypothetical protein
LFVGVDLKPIKPSILTEIRMKHTDFLNSPHLKLKGGSPVGFR